MNVTEKAHERLDALEPTEDADTAWLRKVARCALLWLDAHTGNKAEVFTAAMRLRKALVGDAAERLEEVPHPDKNHKSRKKEV